MPRLGDLGDLGHIAYWSSKLCGAVAAWPGLLNRAAHATDDAQRERPIARTAI